MKSTTITLLILIGLTISVAIISNADGLHTAIWILMLSALKFIGISFFFMDLRKAHTFWKIITCAYLIVFISLVWIII